MKTFRREPLNLNNTFQVFYPASAFELENLKQGIAIATNRLKLEEVATAPPKQDHFYAATTKTRGISFLSALKGPADLIWAARGGYGTIEWLDMIEPELDHYQDKTIIGFSDLTALHSLLSNRGYTSIHGPMLASKNFLEADDGELNSLLLCLHQQKQQFPIQGNQNTQGRLVGGNLSVLSHLMGTPYQLVLKPGDILFLEDINEAPYALARSLKQLSYSPNFEHCHILWGQLTQCSQQTDKDLLSLIMKPYSNSWSYGLNCGHDNPNYSITLGKPAQLEDHLFIQ